MEIPIIKIGNSKGIRFSKTILDKYNFKDKVELILEKERIVLKPISRPREGWEDSFRKMTENNDDLLLIPDLFIDENPDEWK